VHVPGGRAIAEATDDTIYLAIALKNVGNGLAVLDSWDLHIDRQRGASDHGPPERFRRLGRDIYVPAGDLGFWQGTFRDADDPLFAATAEAIAEPLVLQIDILYRDHEGGQRMISRFSLVPNHDGQWIASVSRHWNLDRSDPR
jgi:hypothetical protein